MLPRQFIRTAVTCVVAVCCLVLPTDSWAWKKIVVRAFKSEWDGLNGELQVNGMPLGVENVIWKMHIEYRMVDGGPKFDGSPKKSVPSECALSILAADEPRFEFLKYGRLPKSNVAPEALWKRILIYSKESDEILLVTPKDADQKHPWKLVDYDIRDTRDYRPSPGVQGLTRKATLSRFRLEAATRPGWFLIVKDGKFRLSNDPTTKHVITHDYVYVEDDLDDGK